QAVTAALAGLPRADVTRVSTYWSTGSPPLVSTDRNATYAVLQLTGDDDAARHTSYQAIQAELTPASLASSGVTAQVGGTVPMGGPPSGLLQFPPTGSIDPPMPILMLAVIFGLSMDYEMFLLSRIRERYDQTGDNTAAVASGLQRTGGLITSLALLLIIVVGAFSASGITF